MQAYKNKIYTYDDYLNFPSDKRIELIDGVIYNMSPSPSTKHQNICFDIAFQLKEYIKKKNGKCKVFIAPLDVTLKEIDKLQNKLVNVVQPDVFVVCDESKINDKGCSGAPDLIVEVVSPATKSHDYFKKAALYESFGVREYWIIDPLKSAITIYTLIADGDFNIPVIHNFGDNIKVSIFEELFINTTEF